MGRSQTIPPEQLEHRAALSDWLFAGAAALVWLLVRNYTFSNLPVSLGVDVVLVVLLASVSLSFQRGDPPRWAWALASATFAFAAVGNIFRDQPFASEFADYWGHVYLAVNLCWGATIVVFARNILGTPLKPEWTRLSVVVVGSCVTLALVTAGLLSRDLFEMAQSFEGAPTAAQLGDLLVGFSSAVADAAVFIGAVLLARVVLPMAGGAIARPYLLLSAAAAMYLVLDLVTLLNPDFYTLTGQIVFSLSESLLVAAAVSQLQLLRRQA